MNSIPVASYWFGFLIFVLFSWLFYWPLHKFSAKSWLIALLIAVTSTAAMLFIAREYENKINAEEKVLSQDQGPQILSLDSVKEDSITEDKDVGIQQ